jgi:atypical dual specificity phosphatase
MPLARANACRHPTLPPGSRVRNVIDQMYKVLYDLRSQEGFKAIIIIQSFAAANLFSAYRHLSIFTSPRTPHLLDLGAATSDDSLKLLNCSTHRCQWYMGFSLSSDGSEMIVQNCSHYVNPTSHEQFEKLARGLTSIAKSYFKSSSAISSLENGRMQPIQ